MNKQVKKQLIFHVPYLFVAMFMTKMVQGFRLSYGADLSEKLLNIPDGYALAFENFLPSLHPTDLVIGILCTIGMRVAVYIRSKNAKKYRHGKEYGSARWGNRKDIEPFVDPAFEKNVILTQTESLMMEGRPKNPKDSRNKNVLIIGGSGSGKTRFWLKPNLMQMHSSYVVTDPKGSILVECGKMLQRGSPKLDKEGKTVLDKNGKIVYEPYDIKVLNTINFKKSMKYNPFAYIKSEKDILKLVSTLIANTKGDSKGSDDFWSERHVTATKHEENVIKAVTI